MYTVGHIRNQTRDYYNEKLYYHTLELNIYYNILLIDYIELRKLKPFEIKVNEQCLNS